MKRFHVIVLFSLFALSISSTRSAQVSTNLPPDDKLRHLVCGTWIHDRGGKGHITIGPDNIFFARWQPGSAYDTIWSGTWKVQNGVLMFTNTRSNSVPDLSAFFCPIISVDESNLVYNSDGMKIRLIRKH